MERPVETHPLIDQAVIAWAVLVFALLGGGQEPLTRAKSNLAFETGWCVGRERRVSRVRLLPVQPTLSEYATTSSDTPRHNAAGY
jgi:hypothetical protein